MRRVIVMGDVHDIPEDREHTIQTAEMDNLDGVRTFYRYTFPAAPLTAVNVQKCVEHTSSGHHQYGGYHQYGSAAVPEWTAEPNQHINEFLHIGDYRSEYGRGPISATHLDKMYSKAMYGRETVAGGIFKLAEVDMADAEVRFMAHLNKKKELKNKKNPTAPIPSPEIKQDHLHYSRTLKYNPDGYNSGGDFDEMDNHFKKAAEAVIDEIDAESKSEKSWTDHFKDNLMKNSLMKKEGENMGNLEKFAPGTRITYQDPRTEDMECGTVVGRPPEMRGKVKQGRFLIATDNPSVYHDSYTAYTGIGHGLVIDAKYGGIRELEKGDWHAVPERIGVFVPQAFIQDDVKIPTYATGRILADHDLASGLIKVSWNFENDNFHSCKDEAGRDRHNVWSVPTDKINMCLIDTETKNARISWPNAVPGQGTELKIGDLCTVRGRSVSLLDSDDREVVLSAGTIVELLVNNGGRYRTWSCKILGECTESLVNRTTKIRVDYLKEHPSPKSFYRQGQQVEIVAEIDFRKKPLQGMKGKVILSTDTDGDVGIEFKEDIGAGSLDGIGKEGHCIYIEASLVKSSE